MNVATFVLSTGRCGTQWLATALAAAYPDQLAVAHEPLHTRYEARAALGHAAAAAAGAAPMPDAVLRHLDTIASQLETRGYLECGHPNWSSIPQLIARFPGRARVVHLVRHPVPTSVSWLTHQAFQPPLLPHLAEKILLTPFDAGVRFTDYRARWASLSAFEKCLYYWTEVNALGLSLANAPDVPCLRVRFEDLFDGDALPRLLDFLGLPWRDELLRHRRNRIDAHHALLAEGPDWRVIHDHPHAIAVARALDYDVDDVDGAALARRFLGAGA
jgi:hypothetical protein